MDCEGDPMKVTMLPTAPINHIHLQSRMNVGCVQSLDSGAHANKSTKTQASTCHSPPAYRNTSCKRNAYINFLAGSCMRRSHLEGKYEAIVSSWLA